MRFKQWLLLSERIEVNGVQFRDKLDALKHIYNNHPNPQNLVVSYTEINKIGINPKSQYKTPIGIYFYPLKYVIDKNLKVPFAGDQPYINICEIVRPNKILHMQEPVEPQLGIDLLNKTFTSDKTEEAMEWIEKSNFEYRSNYSTVWLVTQIISNQNPILWNTNLRKLGIDGFIDHDTGTIHTGEPTQGVALSANALKVIHVIENIKQVSDESKFTEALQKGNITAVDYFIQNKNVSLDYAVEIAAENGHLPLVKHLIEKYDAGIYDAVNDAAKNGHFDIIKYLVDEKKANIDSFAVVEAGSKGYLDIVKYLIEKGAKINKYAVGSAASHNQFDVVKYLLGEEVNLNGQKIKLPANVEIGTIDDSAIKNVARNGNLDLVKYLVQKGGKITDADIKHMIEKNYIDIIVYFLSTGKLSPHYVAEEAAKNGSLNLIKNIVNMGFKIDEEVFVKAADFGSIKIVKYLLEELKLDVGMADIQRSILHAANRGVFNTVLYLAEKYPKVGALAITDAARYARIDVIKHIVDNLKSPTSQLQLNSAAEKAKEYGYDNIVDYLVSKGAKRPVDNPTK